MQMLLMLATAGLVGGTMNALAGGGSFVTPPAMIAAGIPSVGANASSTVALYPGGAASAWVYRDGLASVDGLPFISSLIATLIGGFAGALLLIWTPSSVFDRLLPFLLLTATITLILGPRLGAMRLPVIVYVLTIVTMVVGALEVMHPVLTTGAVLFFASDLAVARDKFVEPGFANRSWGLPCYYAGQLLIAWSLRP